MVKTKGPLLSADAHGSIGDVLTYSHRKSGKQVRKYTRPGKIPTVKQRGQRRLTEFLVAHWQNMSDADKAIWATKAKDSGRNLAGYHYFLREAQRDLYTHHGLCLYLPMNEIVGGQVLDLSGLGNHGTLGVNYPSVAPTLVKSRTIRFSNALEFNGTNRNISFAPTRKHLHGDFTVELWVQPIVVGDDLIFNQYGTPTGNANRFYIIFAAPNKIKCFVYDKNSANVLLETNPNLVVVGNWYAYAITHNNTTLQNIAYLNGIAQDDTELSAAERNNDRQIWEIGSSQVPSYFLDGIADEFCIYNRVLSATEIATRYKMAR